MTTASHTCTIGPSAVTGERCGRPAVSSFVSRRTGERFFECAEHDTSHIVARTDEIAAGDTVTVTHIGIEKPGVVVAVRRTRVDVEVSIHGGEATKVITRAIEDVTR